MFNLSQKFISSINCYALSLLGPIVIYLSLLRVDVKKEQDDDHKTRLC